MNRIIDIPNVISITSFIREPLGIEIPSFPACFRKNSFIIDEVTFFRSY